ncbi:MAG: class I SAM-dependent methyltransferase [Devosia sp.]|nr:class I SAM-dependent methyltransferase [Devosia sp.]
MNWKTGYVTDLGYTYGFYRELTPQVQVFSGLANRVDFDTGSAGKFTYCELGCGQGFSTNLLAAANPAADFYATDFNPAQITGARRLANAAGAENVRFFDDSFEEFCTRDDLPKFDVIALHGIYSWIAHEQREIIVGFINRWLKVGGRIYISFNCLPGWAGPSPLRHLMYLKGKQVGGSTGSRVEPALAFIERLAKADPLYFATVPNINARIERLKGHNRNYLAHEYLNDVWEPFYHSDVSRDLDAARLSYVGSAHLLDHVDAVNLTADQQAILAETADPVFRETLRDYMVNQQFRRDIFARGTVPLSAGEAREIWLDSRFALSTPRAEVPLKVTGALGEATLQEDIYAPLLDAFAKPVEAGRSAAISLRQLLADTSKLADLGWARIQQAILVLVGAGHLQPCPADAKGEGKRRESTKRFNLAVMEKARYSADLQFLASPVTGGGIAVDRFQQLFLLAQAQGDKDPAGFVWRVLDAQGQRIVKDGKALESVDDNLAELKDRYAAFEKRLPTLKSLGIA